MIKPRRTPARAFTIIEIVVVIAIITILVLLLIPAVQRARESARRASCLNNLRQIAIGINSYVSSVGSLPMGGNGLGYSPIVAILPFIEQSQAFSNLNFSLPATITSPGSANFTVAALKISILLCPSDPTLARYDFGTTSYAANKGVDYRNGIENGAFLLRSQRPVNYSEFSDGISSTALVAEWVVGPGGLTLRDPTGSVFGTHDGLDGESNFEQFIRICENLNTQTTGIQDNDKGVEWILGGYMRTCYNHNNLVNNHSCINNGNTMEGAFSSGSKHLGGANVSFADGHVAFVKDTIDLRVWRAIGTRNGGEVVSKDD